MQLSASLHPNRAGITVIELLVVLAILAALAAIAIPNLSQAVHETRDVQTQTAVNQVSEAVQAHEAVTGTLPGRLDSLLTSTGSLITGVPLASNARIETLNASALATLQASGITELVYTLPDGTREVRTLDTTSEVVNYYWYCNTSRGIVKYCSPCVGAGPESFLFTDFEAPRHLARAPRLEGVSYPYVCVSLTLAGDTDNDDVFEPEEFLPRARFAGTQDVSGTFTATLGDSEPAPLPGAP